MDSHIGDIAALGEYEVSEAWGNFNDLLDGGIGESGARCQVKNAEVLKLSPLRQRQEGFVVDEVAACQS